MNTLEIFQYQNTPVSFKNENGKVFVNATEIAKRFDTKPDNWLRTEPAQKMISALSTSHICDLADLVQVINGGNERGTWMHEDVALVFAQWLSPEFYIWCNDRIKELLKHGATAMNPNDLLNPDFIINLATQLKTERARTEYLLVTAQQQAKELKESAPKVEYYDEVLQSESLIVTNVIAKQFGMSATSLNRFLNKMGVIYRCGGTWVLYHKHQNKGYTGTKTFTYKDSLGREKTQIQTYWKEKGKEFIAGLLPKRIKA